MCQATGTAWGAYPLVQQMFTVCSGKENQLFLWAMFPSYVKLPEGKSSEIYTMLCFKKKCRDLKKQSFAQANLLRAWAFCPQYWPWTFFIFALSQANWSITFSKYMQIRKQFWIQCLAVLPPGELTYITMETHRLYLYVIWMVHLNSLTDNGQSSRTNHFRQWWTFNRQYPSRL